MKIIIDSREQAPFDFSPFPDCEAIRGTLATGDYSLYGFAAEIAIERKGIDDLIQCMTGERERFTRELERLRGYNSAMIVVEAPFNAIRCGMYRSRMNPDAAVQSIFSWMQRFKLPFFFANDRADGAFATYSFIRHFHEHETARLKRLAL